MLRIVGSAFVFLVLATSPVSAFAKNCGEDPIKDARSLADLNALPKNAWIEYQRCLANQKDADAQLNMGIAYRDGSDGPPKNLVEAFKWFQLSALQGNKAAQFNLGMMYDNGRGVRQDYAKAVNWYRKAIDQGSVTAKYRLAYHYFYGFGIPKNPVKASELYEQAKARTGFANEFALAHYQEGSEPEAVRWIRFVAEQGDADALFNLAIMYYNGQGVPQDYVEAVKWFSKAAEQGVPEAQYNLGLMYFNGQGVPQDYVEAHFWSNLAAAQGYKEAIRNRDIMAKKMTPADISMALARAREWLEAHQK